MGMALEVQQQAKIWAIAGVVFLVVLWFLGDVILPFVLGGAIAYCLDPIADWLERLGLGRALATTLITLVAILLFVIMALAVIPTLIEQTVALVQVAPQLATDLQAFLAEKFPAIMDQDSIIRQSLNKLGETIQSKGGAVVEPSVVRAEPFERVGLGVHRAGGGVLFAAGLGPYGGARGRHVAARSCTHDPQAGERD